MVDEERFPVVDVAQWEIVEDETSGAEEKYWLVEPETDLRWLFKSVTIKNGLVHGEDWAEKAVGHLAGLVGVPCARIEMAQMGRTQGCICADLRPDPYELQHGQMLLEERQVPGYEHRQGGPDHPGHSVENIARVLSDVLPPPGCEVPFAASAFDIFAGYMVLDAWIANCDRHDNNWAVLRPITDTGEPLRLCGSYDHGNSLGYNVPTLKRTNILQSPEEIERWCRRGHAKRFERPPEGGKVTLVDMAARALRSASPAARDYWPRQLAAVQTADVLGILTRVPRMSEEARIFGVQMLDVNRRRILDVCT